MGGRCYTAKQLEKDYLSEVAGYSDPDLTPLAVRRLCQALFGRTGSQWLIVEIFGVKGRQHRSDDSTPESVEKMATRYRHAAGLHWAATLAEIERVKRNYQTQVKASRKGEG